MSEQLRPVHLVHHNGYRLVHHNGYRVSGVVGGTVRLVRDGEGYALAIMVGGRVMYLCSRWARWQPRSGWFKVGGPIGVLDCEVLDVSRGTSGWAAVRSGKGFIG